MYYVQSIFKKMCDAKCTLIEVILNYGVLDNNNDNESPIRKKKKVQSSNCACLQATHSEIVRYCTGENSRRPDYIWVDPKTGLI